MQYKIDLGSSGSITPRVDVNHQAETFTGFDGTGANRLAQFLPAFTMANARLTWRNDDQDLSIALEVTNLTDQNYFYSVFDQRNNNGGRIGPARPAARMGADRAQGVLIARKGYQKPKTERGGPCGPPLSFCPP